jgi:hypothetical protein
MKTTSKYSLLLAGCLLATVAQAGNRTIAGTFEGGEPDTLGSPVNCEQRQRYPYIKFTGLRVSQTGEYQVAESALPEFLVNGSLDSVIMFYVGSFDPNNPTSNRIGLFNYAAENYSNKRNFVNLSAGQSYTIMIVPFCLEDNQDPRGVFSWAMRGPGDISGAGFNTPTQFYGDFSMVNDVADFEEWGRHKYVTFAYTAEKEGNHWLREFGGWEWDGSPTPARLHSAPFDPEDTEANRITPPWPGGEAKVYLKAGETVYVVLADYFDNDAFYQVITFPPGELTGMNPSIGGTYYNPSIAYQGVLVETDMELNLAFGAAFTFEAPAVAQTAEGVGGSKQRWLSFSGGIDPESTVVPLQFSNTTGGRFNMAEPPAKIDTKYGSGEMRVKDCNTIEISYVLPGVPDGQFDLVRLLPALGEDCANYVDVGLPQP